MSQYRDDLDAARRRIEALETRVAEGDAELARRATALVAREEEILRLQRELELAGGLGPRHMRSVSAAWASRIVGAATGLAVVVAGAGVVLVRSSAAASSQGTGETPEALAFEQPPIHADPLVSHAVDWASQETVETPSAVPVPANGEVPRQMDGRVWGGRPAADESRMRKGICAERGDPACRPSRAH
jgi:hypothetical protein